MSGPGTGPGDGAGSDALARRLSPLVEAEARRVLSEAQLAADPARVAEGWERRFIADGARAEEAIRLYEELGYEVCADPLEAGDLTGDCDDCQLLMLLGFQTIYTRRKSAGAQRRA
ncbi:MAG: hypothetical protein AAB409_01410 [Gemmatimonadota bacterium]